MGAPRRMSPRGAAKSRVLAVVAGRLRPVQPEGAGGSPAPLVAGAELAVLTGALRQAVDGNGSVVVLVGDPGIGKTRLVQECRRRFLAWAGAARAIAVVARGPWRFLCLLDPLRPVPAAARELGWGQPPRRGEEVLLAALERP